MSKKTRQVQISLAILAAILAVVLFIAPARKKNLKSVKPSQTSFASIDQIISSAKADLAPDQLSTIASWERSIDNENKPSNLALYDSLASSWDGLQYPYLAAYYLRRKSEIDQSNISFLKSARKYYNAFYSLKDSSLKANSLNEATQLFERALDNDSENEEIKLDLALCYVEGPAPMQGIMILRELVKSNPQNESALFNLGILSMRSGQYGKALERFNQILEFAPNRFELFLYMADCYLQLGEKDQAIDYFSRFKSQTNDKGLAEEIDIYIEKLKKEE